MIKNKSRKISTAVVSVSHTERLIKQDLDDGGHSFCRCCPNYDTLITTTVVYEVHIYIMAYKL